MTDEMYDLIKILNHRGLGDGLKFLNRRVPYRYTAIYKMVRDEFKLQHLEDKLNEPVAKMLQSVAYEDSYCQYSIGMGEFLTSDSGQDARLNGHKQQGVVGSYVGLPLMHVPGTLFGTLCHYDMEPQPQITNDEFNFLQQACRVLPRYLQRQPA